MLSPLRGRQRWPAKMLSSSMRICVAPASRGSSIKNFSFTLRDFLQDRCTAERRHCHRRTFRRSLCAERCRRRLLDNSRPPAIFWFVDYLKNRFAMVIIDLPPIVGLADTIRLAMAADNIILVIRWGRTERQFVQFALDTLRSARRLEDWVILNDIDLKAQRRRGYRDHTLVYTDKGLYRAAPGYRERAAAPQASWAISAAKQDTNSEINVSEPPGADTHRGRPRPAGSDIERLYNKYHE